MKTIYFNSRLWNFIFQRLGAFILLCMSSWCVASDSVIINFSATLEAPTCTMSIPQTIDFGITQGSSPNAIPSTSLQGNGVSMPVNITFSDCSNKGLSAPKPQILLKGNAVHLGGTEFFFADSPSVSYPAQGFGVKLSVNGDPNFEDNDHIITNGGSNGGGALLARPNTTISSLNNSTLILTASLSCGSYSPCSNAPAYEVGAFKSSVTFQLLYD
ncbi:fimbrial protein [Providencia vermicola]|uniref:fimbrial protein n=1 Tax=Providencia vermicola TaxID=333965 RepID=UPI00352573E3